MNLRTITCWAVYDPKKKEIVAFAQFKNGILWDRHPGCVPVKLKGHYVRRVDREAAK